MKSQIQFLLVYTAILLAKPIKILIPVAPWSFLYERDHDLMIAGAITALSPSNLNNTHFNTTDIILEKVKFDPDKVGESIAKIGWACRSGEYQAVLADQRSRDAKVFAKLCGHYKVPITSLHSGANILGDKSRYVCDNSRYPTLFRYLTSLDLYMQSYLLFIRQMSWKNLVIVAATDNTLWTEAAALAQSKAKEYGITVLSQLSMTNDITGSPIADYKEAIEQLKFSKGKIVLILSYQVETFDFVLACEYYGLSRKDYVFILVNEARFPDSMDKIQYWAQHGISASIASRRGLVEFHEISNYPKIEKWNKEIFLPNLNGVIKQGPYDYADMAGTGMDDSKYFPRFLYDSSLSTIPSDTVLFSYDATNRFIRTWDRVFCSHLDDHNEQCHQG